MYNEDYMSIYEDILLEIINKGDVTVAKNMVFGLTYYDTKALKSDIDNNFNGSKAKVVWGEFNAYF